MIKLYLTLHDALAQIEGYGYQEFPVGGFRNVHTCDELLAIYGDAKWLIVHMLNSRYGHRLAKPFDLFNWIHKQRDDEVAFFLNEAGSNVLNHAEHGIPHKLQVWSGEKGFIIGICQEGKGFDPRTIVKPGGGFRFFASSRSTIFFDDLAQVHSVYLLHMF